MDDQAERGRSAPDAGHRAAPAVDGRLARHPGEIGVHTVLREPHEQAQPRVAERLPQNALDVLRLGGAVAQAGREGLDARHGARPVAIEAPVGHALQPPP